MMCACNNHVEIILVFYVQCMFGSMICRGVVAQIFFYGSCFVLLILLGTSTWKDDFSSTHEATRPDTGTDMHAKSRDPQASAAAKSSFQNAVYIYSGKMGGVQPRQRPSSAVSSNKTRKFVGFVFCAVIGCVRCYVSSEFVEIGR